MGAPSAFSRFANARIRVCALARKVASPSKLVTLRDRAPRPSRQFYSRRFFLFFPLFLRNLISKRGKEKKTIRRKDDEARLWTIPDNGTWRQGRSCSGASLSRGLSLALRLLSRRTSSSRFRSTLLPCFTVNFNEENRPTIRGTDSGCTRSRSTRADRSCMQIFYVVNVFVRPVRDSVSSHSNRQAYLG